MTSEAGAGKSVFFCTQSLSSGAQPLVSQCPSVSGSIGEGEDQPRVDAAPSGRQTGPAHVSSALQMLPSQCESPTNSMTHTSSHSTVLQEGLVRSMVYLYRLPHAPMRPLRVTSMVLTRSSKNHGHFSWPSIHIFATLGKQMHFGFLFFVAYSGCCVPLQLHGRVAHKASVM